MNFNDIWKVRNIKIGAQNDFHFSFFEQQNQSDLSNLMLGYGHNGSGKTTLGKLFKKIRTCVEEDSYESLNQLEFVMKGEQHKPKKIQQLFDKESFLNLHVFNRDFITEHIELHESDDLDAIVMFGSDAEDYREIKNLKKANEDLDLENKALKISKNGLSEKTKDLVKRIEGSYMKTILNSLRSRNIERQEKEYRSRSFLKYVNETITIKQIEDEIACINELREKDKMEKINIQLTKIPDFHVDMDFVFERMPQPVLSEKEKKIVDLIKFQSGYTNWLSNGKEMIEKVDENCPLCFNQIDRNGLLEKIEEILNPAVAKMKEQLEKEIESIDRFIERMDQLGKQYSDAKEYKNVLGEVPTFLQNSEGFLSAINEEILKLRKLLQSRIENVYVLVDKESYKKTLAEIQKNIQLTNEQIDILGRAILGYNNSIDNANNQLKEAEKKTKEMVENFVIQEIKPWVIEEKELKKKIKLNNDFQLENLKRINELRSKARNLEYCMNLINKELSFIFYSADKMKLVPERSSPEQEIQGYKVLIDGRPVKKRDLSTGEQNILAIIYFFKTLNKEKEIGVESTEPLFVVLDDPISSLDENNIVGLISYIKYEIEVIRRNKESKAMILTHRWYVYDSIRKLFTHKNKMKLIAFELERNNEKTIQKFIHKHEDVSNYKELITMIYDYANGVSKEKEHMIGNILRRSMEAYFTFNYRLGFDEGLRDEDIARKVSAGNPGNVCGDFIRNFTRRANRLILNTESHLEDQSKNFGRELSEFFFSSEEKRQLCQGWLGMLLLLDEIHLVKHLGSDNWTEKKAIIEKWIGELGGNKIEEEMMVLANQ